MENKKGKKVLLNKTSNKTSITDKLNKKSDFKIYELLLFGFLIILISVLITLFLVNEINYRNTSKSIISKNNRLDEFNEVYDLINNSYYKKVDKNKLINGAINGMLKSLDDPHTSYFNESEEENFNELMNGSYEGIGAEITQDKQGNIIVFSVFKNSPAKEAGIKVGDVIEEVNGKSVKGLSTIEVTSLIKKKDTEKARIKIIRNGEALTFDVEKRNVIIDSVESKLLTKNGKQLGYIIVNNFANNTYEQFRSNLQKLEESNISGLIIDVRYNTGGYLHSVTNMINMFLPKGKVIYQISDRKNTQKYIATTDESRNYPVAILVNSSSASASEILAISLKESYGAFVVGTNTYGKGTVQITKELKSGGMIKYTIQKWLSPKGNWINEKGVTPTNVVLQSEEYEKNPTLENDNQLQKAIDLVAGSK